MAEQPEPSDAAVQARQSALAVQRSAAEAADLVFSQALRDAHAASAAARERFDAIAAEIEDCVQNQDAFAADTPLGAHELQRFLVAKCREMTTVVSEARRDDVAKQTLLGSLRLRYSPSVSPA